MAVILKLQFELFSHLLVDERNKEKNKSASFQPAETNHH